MAGSAVSFLLEKLSMVLRDQRELFGGFKHEVQSINDELVQMKEYLRVADAKEETDTSLKEWVKQLREISFDFEDVLDKNMLRFGQPCNTVGLCDCLKKVCGLIEDWKAQHQIASEIKAIKCRLENVAKCQEKYQNMVANKDQGSSSTIPKTQEYDGRGDALLLEEDEVVGIQKPKEKLIGWIHSKDSGLEVISVVGPGGLGKTTLAKKVYDFESVKSSFDRHVRVVVSDYVEDVKLVLKNLIKNLFEEFEEPPPQGLNDMSFDDMRNFIKEFLKNKKYIIVLNDVWKRDTWAAIKVALPVNDGCGCIIITTRDQEIGNLACSETNHVFNLKPLTEEESKVLFFRKAFPRNRSCPSYLRKFAENILRRCEGLPLAIVVIGGLLATKENRMEEWELLNRSLGLEDDHRHSLVRLRRIFSLSYIDLPYFLKYCFLYLSIFPEGSLLKKEKIVRLWVAEGFVQSEQQKTLEEVAEKYLQELWSRSLIQVARKHIDGRVREFRIHDLLRDYITSKSREHNLVTAYDGGENQWPNKIRRLAIQNSGSFSVETNNFEYLRSLLLLSNKDIELGMINELVSRSRLLKVLELTGAPMEMIPDGVFKLYHLKHLCLRNTRVKVIPAWIKDLRNLETLDLKNTSVTELPVGILNLQKLRHLLVYTYMPGILYKAPFDKIQSFRAPYDIGSHLQSLQKLCCVDADEVENIKIVSEVGKLTQLKRLGIAKLKSGDGKELCASIAKLSNLRSLRIDSIEEGEKLDLDYSLISSTGLPLLRTLILVGRIEKVPQWIPSLHSLTTLDLRWSKLSEDPLIYLQDLPNLTNLLIQDADVEELSFRSRGFQKLKQLQLMEFGLMERVIVEQGSLPTLEDWRMYGCKLLMELPQGMEHLTNLQYVGFNDMPNEFEESVYEERINKGDNWRLASARRVSLGTMTDDGSWSFVRLWDRSQKINGTRYITFQIYS